jgi:hypothetical protein
MNTNPTKQTMGATTIRRVLKMSGSKWVSVELGPVISNKPIIIMTIPTAIRIKFVLSRANFSFILF